MLNKHGLPMTHIKSAAGATNYIFLGVYQGIYYNTETGMIHYRHYRNWYGQTIFDDPAIIHVCTVNYCLTMQQIADHIAQAVAAHNYCIC